MVFYSLVVIGKTISECAGQASNFKNWLLCLHEQWVLCMMYLYSGMSILCYGICLCMILRQYYSSINALHAVQRTFILCTISTGITSAGEATLDKCPIRAAANVL